MTKISKKRQLRTERMLVTKAKHLHDKLEERYNSGFREGTEAMRKHLNQDSGGKELQASALLKAVEGIASAQTQLVCTISTLLKR